MAWSRWLRDPGPPHRRGRRGGGTRLVEECEAFLTGRLAERIDQEGGPVSAWMWTNLLAHGREDDLGAEGLVGDTDDWHIARASLAAHVLDLATSYGPLAAIQQRVLIPLELDLASRPEVAAWEPRGWVSAVENALNVYRRQCRRAAER